MPLYGIIFGVMFLLALTIEHQKAAAESPVKSPGQAEIIVIPIPKVPSIPKIPNAPIAPELVVVPVGDEDVAPVSQDNGPDKVTGTNKLIRIPLLEGVKVCIGPIGLNCQPAPAPPPPPPRGCPCYVWDYSCYIIYPDCGSYHG